MGLMDRVRDLDTPALVALALGVAVVGLVLLVVLVVVVAAVLGTFVLGVGEETGTGDVDTTVQAGVSVTGDEDASEATVTWTSNQNAEVLRVEWTTAGGTVTPSGGMDGDTGDRTARLTTVGESLTLSADDPGTATTVEVTVTAVHGDQEAVIVVREVTI